VSNKWRRLIFYPFIVGVILSIIVVLLFIHIFPAIELEVVENVQLKNNCSIFYSDCDHDGYSEKFNYCSYDRLFPQTLFMYNYKEQLKGLWNVHEDPFGNDPLFVDNYNSDRTSEIFLFTQNLDSVFLYIFDSANDKKHITYRKFISDKAENSKLEILPLGLFLMNDDQFKDFVFIIRSPVIPELNKVAFYDIHEQKVHFSSSFNAYLKKPFIVDDLNHDDKVEIVVSNQSIAKEMQEEESTFVVLNNQLKNCFNRVVFKGAPSQVTVSVVDTEKEKHIAVIHSSLVHETFFNTFMFYDLSGKRVDEKIMNEKSEVKLLDIPEKREEIFVLSNNKCMVKDKNFETLYDVDFYSDTVEFIKALDINGDNNKEFIFKDKHHIYFVSNNLKHIKNLKISPANNIMVSSMLMAGSKPDISLQAGKQWIILNYSENNSFLTSYVFYLAIFFIIIAFVFFSFRLFSFIKSRRKKASDLEYEISELDAKMLQEINDTHGKSKVSIDEVLIKSKMNVQDKMECTSVDVRKQLDSLVFENYKSKIKYSIFPEYWGGFPSEFCVDLNAIIKRIVGAIDHLNCETNIELIKHKNCLNISIEIQSAEENKGKVFESLITVRKQMNQDRAFEIEEIQHVGIVVNLSFDIETEHFKQTKVEKVKVIIAEDHDVSLFGLTSLFKTKEDIEIVGTARNGMEVLKILESKKANIVITDISMPGMDGIELTEKLQKDYPAIKVIVFTMYMENWFVEQLIQNGAKAFVSKSSKINELIEAVRKVNEGGNYYCPQFKSKFGFNGSSTNSNKLESLNRSEMEILKLYAENLNKEKIASRLSINPKTFDAFVSNILLKLNAAGEEELKKIAKMQKFVSE